MCERELTNAAQELGTVLSDFELQVNSNWHHYYLDIYQRLQAGSSQISKVLFTPDCALLVWHLNHFLFVLIII